MADAGNPRPPSTIEEAENLARREAGQCDLCPCAGRLIARRGFLPHLALAYVNAFGAAKTAAGEGVMLECDHFSQIRCLGSVSDWLQGKRS